MEHQTGRVSTMSNTKNTSQGSAKPTVSLDIRLVSSGTEYLCAVLVLGLAGIRKSLRSQTVRHALMERLQRSQRWDSTSHERRTVLRRKHSSSYLKLDHGRAELPGLYLAFDAADTIRMGLKGRSTNSFQVSKKSRH